MSCCAYISGTLNSVESYLTFSLAKQNKDETQNRGFINFGTWESAVYM